MTKPILYANILHVQAYIYYVKVIFVLYLFINARLILLQRTGIESMVIFFKFIVDTSISNPQRSAASVCVTINLLDKAGMFDSTQRSCRGRKSMDVANISSIFLSFRWFH
jgi:hypothetical protein